MKNLTCCNKQLELKDLKKDGKKTGEVFYHCQICGKKGKGKTEQEARLAFYEFAANVPALPKSSNQLSTWAESNLNKLMEASATFVDKPATVRMIHKNIQYIMNQDSNQWKSVWASPAGVQSLVDALNESLWMGTILPNMGYLVPFDGKVEFMPRIESFEFALTHGKNAPFEWLKIECIYENDNAKPKRKDGNFYVDWGEEIPLERGELVGIAVHGYEYKSKKIVGEYYEAKRLLGKAAQCSKSYRKYLKDLMEFEKLKSEGIAKSGFDKTCPWVGPNFPEMARKMAGKSFGAPYINIRNSAEMATEWQNKSTEEPSATKIIDAAFEVAHEQFAAEATEDVPATEARPEQKPEQMPVPDEITDEEQASLEALM